MVCKRHLKSANHPGDGAQRIKLCCKPCVEKREKNILRNLSSFNRSPNDGKNIYYSPSRPRARGRSGITLSPEHFGSLCRKHGTIIEPTGPCSTDSAGRNVGGAWHAANRRIFRRRTFQRRFLADLKSAGPSPYALYGENSRPCDTGRSLKQKHCPAPSPYGVGD